MLDHDAIELLKSDHAKMRQLLQRFEASTDRGVETRRQLLQEITTELEAHITIETEIFYPAYRDAVTSNAAEEEKEMFPKACTALGALALQELGSRMAVRKDEILLLEAWRSAADDFNGARSAAVVA